MDGLWKNLFGGAATAGGIYGLMDMLQSGRDDVSSTISGLQDMVKGNVQFNPYTVTSGMGSISQGPGGGSYALSGPFQGMSDAFLQAAGGSLGATTGGQDYLSSLLTAQRAGQTDPRSYTGIADMKRNAMGLGNQYMGLAGQDPTAREGDIYNRIRSMQQPEEQRAQQQMNNSLFASGRGGMGTSTYGSTPEQFGFEKARAEAMNQAGYQAMNQAQQEMKNYGAMANQFAGLGSGLAGQQQDLASKNVSDIVNIAGGMGNLGMQGASAASGLFGAAMSPYEQMMGFGKLGQGNQAMNLETILNQTKMLGDLGLGGLGTELNYSNIMSNLLGQAVPALAGAAGGLGGQMDQAGGMFDFIKNIFGG